MPLNDSRSVTFTTPGQNGNLTFAAQAGQRIIIRVSDHTFGGTANVKQVIIVGTTGSGPVVYWTPVTSISFAPINTEYTPDGVSIPVSGTYNIELNPKGPSIGTMTVALYIVPGDAEYTMNIGSSQSISTAARGQNVWVNFDGIAGQRVSLRTREVTYPGGFMLSENKPNGSYFVTPLQAGNATFVDTLTLPVTGRYKVFINPHGFDIGGATLDLFDVPPDIVGTTSINGPPVTVSAYVPGHNPSVEFIAAQGQQARVNISSASVPNNTPVYIRKPDGSILASTVIGSGVGLISSVTLPATGTYTVEVNPHGVNLGSATIAVGGDVSGTATPGGTSVTTTIDNPGQSSWLTFNGTAGQLISAKLTNVTIASGYASIRKADGSLLGNSISIAPNATNFIDTVTLPSTGQYSVLIDPVGESTGSATVTVYNVPGDAAGSISVGSSQTKSTTVPGQNLSLTFSGTANQRISVELTNVSISSSVLIIKKPDGSNLASTGFGIAGGSLTNVVLPIAGTYQIYLDPVADAVGSAAIGLFGDGTGTANPSVQLAHGVSVLKGTSSNAQTVLFSSVSVFKGVLFESNGNGLFSNSVSVTTGPNITSLSPLQLAKGSTVVVSISGSNLSTVNALRFLKTDGSLDSGFTVTNISVNTEGTILTATIQTSANAALGERVVILNSPSLGSSQSINLGTNVVTIVQ